MGSSTSSITAPTFTGSSTFSSSFQQVLTRAVQMASLPIQQMQNNVNDFTNQETALTQLGAVFQSLDAALQAIGNASGGGISASVSDPSVLSATTTSSALPGTYSIQVDSLGAYAASMSQAGSPVITDPTTQSISSASSFTLTVNGVPTTITPADGSLEGLANAINSSSAGVQATIVNVGSNTSPDYRLVVTNNSLGDEPIQLSDGSDLLNPIAQGAPATYQVNGSSTILQSNSRQVTLSPGLTVTMLDTSSQPETITVSSDFTALQTALTNFATAYNSVTNAVAQQYGQNGGALSGQSIVYELTGVLQSVSQYSSGSGSVGSLTDLGLTVDKTGQMSFDASAFSAQNTAAITQFLGSATTGGFIQAATSALSSVDDVNSGDLESEYAVLQGQINSQNQRITDAQARVTQMETNLEAVLAQADAAIANLQAQKTYYTQLFQAEYFNNGTSGG